MTLIPVNSSAIAAIGYEDGYLYIVFHSSPKLYDYPGVPYRLFEDFLNASSPGRFYARYISGRY